jgi:hypothetical protein
MESDQLGSLNQLAGFAKVTLLHAIFVGHASLGKVALSPVSACELSHIEGKVAGRVPTDTCSLSAEGA